MSLSIESKDNFFLDEVLLQKTFTKQSLFVFSTIDSTNQYLLEQAKNINHGAICLAQEQTAGRGRRGRVWHSPVANIYLSQFFHYSGDQKSISGLSLVVGIAIAKTLSELDIPDIKLKWPNDLYWQNKKLGGILLETVPLEAEKLGIVVGVGINFAMQESQETEQIAQNWVSLSSIANVPINKTELVIKLVQAIEKMTSQYLQEGMQPFLSPWLSFDNFLNKKVKLLAEDIETLGIAKGIDTQGALLVEVNGELIAFHSGEVSLRAVEN